METPGAEPSHQRLLNVLVGTPNRVKKLVEFGSIKVTKKKFKYIVIDTELNSKQLSIFDIKETRDDTLDLLLLSQKQLLKQNLKLLLI